MKGFVTGLILAMSLAGIAAYKIGDNIFLIGDKNDLSSDKELQVLDDAGSPITILKRDETNNITQISNDGVEFFGLDELGGGLSGITGVYNNLDNPGFEEGFDVNWSCSSTDCAEDDTTPLYGTKSITYSPDDTSDYLRSDFKLIPEGMLGKSCEARVSYTANQDEKLVLRVVNQDLEVIASRTLPSASSPAKTESLFFLCPSGADYIADNDKGILRLEVVLTDNTPTDSEFDDMHLGLLIGLVETTLPDVFSFKVSGAGVVSDESVDIINGNCTVSPTGTKTCPVISGALSVVPNCTVSDQSSVNQAGYDSTSSTSSNLVFKTSDATGSALDAGITVTCQKQGTDAKQSVQVYKSIPKVADNDNHLSARIDSTLNITSQSVSWIDSVTNPSTGNKTIDYTNLGLTVIPKFNITPSASCISAFITAISTTSVSIGTRDGTGTQTDCAVAIDLHKQGADYKKPVVQPVIVGQVRNSYAESASKNVRTEYCSVAHSGVPATARDYCDTWIDSITDSGTGFSTINFVTDIFSATPINPSCNCTAATSADVSCSAVITANTSVAVYTRNTAGTLVDTPYYINCFGGY